MKKKKQPEMTEMKSIEGDIKKEEEAQQKLGVDQQQLRKRLSI